MSFGRKDRAVVKNSDAANRNCTGTEGHVSRIAQSRTSTGKEHLHTSMSAETRQVERTSDCSRKGDPSTTRAHREERPHDEVANES